MRVVVSIKAAPGGGTASQAARYIAYRDRDEEREGTEPRQLFSAKETRLSFWQAERTLTAGRTPTKDEVAHLAVSLKADDFQALGQDETTRQQALKEVTREALAEIAQELDAEDLRWVAGVHRNTEHPHLHLLIHKDYVTRTTGQPKRFHRLPESVLPSRSPDENGVEKINPGSFSQAFVSALDRAQERFRQQPPQRAETVPNARALSVTDGQKNTLESRDADTERLLAAAQHNPSLAGRELTTEIILRGAESERTERPSARDLRTAFRPTNLDDPDYRSPYEQADWLGRQSQSLRDFYEHGARLNGDVLTLPTEEHEIVASEEKPFITSLPYALTRIGKAQQATEFHTLAKAIAGQTADVRTEVEVFRHYYAQLKSADHTASREAATEKILTEMRPLAEAMQALETRESVEALGTTTSLDERDENSRREPIGSYNTAARTVNLRDEVLRFPAGLSPEAQEKLVTQSLPTLDRLIESGKEKHTLIAAIEGATYKPELTEEERAERFQVGGFLKEYVEERWRDPETRALNSSAAFRSAHQQLNATTSAAELNRFAEQFLRDNLARGEALRLHKTDPAHHPPPEVLPLNARERNLLFFGRAPEHHTPDMRELRYAWGLSREARTMRVQDLHEGRLQPSETLAKMLTELDTRQSLPALKHYQASLLNEKMDQPGRLDLQPLYERLPPHERTYLLERIEAKKQSHVRPETPQRETAKDEEKRTIMTPRLSGELPRESQAYREYMANMGAIEHRLLNEAVQQRQAATRGIVISKEEYQLSITEARSLLPAETQTKLRQQARQQAWGQLVTPEVFTVEPRAQQLSDTIAHLQEDSQQRARLAHQVLEEFVQEKIGATANRVKINQAALTKLTPNDAQRWQALQDYAVRTREDLYRGFESLDTIRHDIKQTRTVKETLVEKRETELEPNRQERFAAVVSAQTPKIPLPNERALPPNGMQRSGLRLTALNVFPGSWNLISPGILIACLRRTNYR